MFSLQTFWLSELLPQLDIKLWEFRKIIELREILKI